MTRDKEIFRNALLKLLEEAKGLRFGMGVLALQAHLIRFAFPNAPEAEVIDELCYLVSKGLVEEVPRQVNRENRTWRITQAGIAYVDENNL